METQRGLPTKGAEDAGPASEGLARRSGAAEAEVPAARMGSTAAAITSDRLSRGDGVRNAEAPEASQEADGAVLRTRAIDALHRATAIYTAEPVVDQLLAALDWPRGDRRLVDTSCGDGAFLVRALERLLAVEPDATGRRIAHLINGWEIHYFAACEARQRLASALRRLAPLAGDPDDIAQAMVRLGDFLTQGPRTPTWDCIAGNPPFLRYANVPQPLRAEYEATLPDYAQADMLHSFVDASARALRPGGEVALVTSDRWLFNENAVRLREVVGGRLGIDHLERLDAASSFYRPKDRRAGTPPRIHPVAIVLRETSARSQVLGRAPIFPGAAPVEHTSSRTLGDVAQVRLAPWLGTPGVFVVDAETARRLPAEGLVPAVNAKDVRGGVLQVVRRWAIRTERDVAPAPAVAQHLADTAHLMCARGRVNLPWGPPEPFDKLDLTRPSLLVPRIARSLKPIRLPAGVLPIDHGLSIVSAGAASLDKLEEMLTRPEAEAWVRARAPRLENGWFSLTTRLLRALPISEEGDGE